MKRLTPFHMRLVMRANAARDLATITPREVAGDRHDARDPDLSDVASAAADMLCCDGWDRRIPVHVPAPLRVSGDLDDEWPDEPPGWIGWKAAPWLRYVADHEARLRTLTMAG